MKHNRKPEVGQRAETLAFACLGLAGVMMLCFAATSMFHFVDEVPNVVAQLEKKAVSVPALFATLPNTNLVTKSEP